MPVVSTDMDCMDRHFTCIIFIRIYILHFKKQLVKIKMFLTDYQLLYIKKRVYTFYLRNLKPEVTFTSRSKLK